MDSDSSHSADFTGILGLSVRPLEAEMRFRLTLGLASTRYVTPLILNISVVLRHPLQLMYDMANMYDTCIH